MSKITLELYYWTTKMIICVTGYFDKYDKNGFKTGEKEFLVSHGIDSNTDYPVTLPCVHPSVLGAVFDTAYNEYVLKD